MNRHTERLRVLCDGMPVGTLAMADRARIVFEYDASWIRHGFDLAPRSLTFNTEPQLAKERLFGGLHGVFNDSLPDGWGLLLMDRALKQQFGWARHEITPLDRLSYIGQRAMGSLGYQPEQPQESTPDQVDLASMAAQAERILAGSPESVLTALMLHGGSPGGARPKVTVALSPHSDTCLSGLTALPPGYQHWLVKFRSAEDPPDMGRIEKTYADMATLAGLDMPATALQNVVVNGTPEQFFSVRRFDRENSKKRHVVTMAGLFYADFRTPCIDYQDVMAATAMLTKDARQVALCFRLMVFNVLAHNKDDHAKNFSFIWQDDHWQLAPAYDLTFNHGMGGEHMTAIAGSGNPAQKHWMQLASTFRINDAERIVAEVRQAIGQWHALAEANQVSVPLRDEIGAYLAKIGRHFG